MSSTPSASPAKPESTVTVIVAFLANLLIAVAKTVAAFLTGSASMVAESAHSWADTGNEVFLFVADKRGVKRRDDAHPLGYGKETYVWSMFAAFGLFTVGAVVSIQHGISQLTAEEEAENYLINYVVLAIAFVLEGTSFLQAFRQARGSARERGAPTLRFVLRSSNSTLRAVFAEDAAALVGLLIAFLGIFLHQITGSAVFDAIGSIAVGVLLGVVALVLVDRNRRFLVGESPSDELESTVLERLLARPEIARVTYLHTEFVGPGRLYLVAAVDMTGNDREEHVAVALRRVERELEDHDAVEEAVLTLSTPDEPSLTPRRASDPARR
ncbi:cation diffusion facilitator family transporter [Frigoribacterium sp. Leaf44]|jgi:cation diffusion facilitator family transporter|uniref:cation diffusion facilitator family transporter n=1 Tax=Frigoribacterium sp. Leaf44 TaxID=1736220 RepID=UPI0006FEA4D1|nr:cation transporter [Frigoribacterium sp. Leaf44]KQN43164.1 cation diffusion facilitator family transporter [Frigoribacterium sp. Leaf44]